MSNININMNSRVRIGKGRVEYTVFAVTEKGFNLQDDNGRNRYDVSADKLTVIEYEPVEAAITQGEKSVEQNFPSGVGMPFAGEEIVETTEEVSWDLAVKDIAATLPLGTFVITDDNAPLEFKSFEAAAFALSRDHMYSRAVIVRDNVIKATR